MSQLHLLSNEKGGPMVSYSVEPELLEVLIRTAKTYSQRSGRSASNYVNEFLKKHKAELVADYEGISGHKVFDYETANNIWNVLAKHCGASERGREDFVATAIQGGITEYRFIGGLGFGGKFWGHRLKVTCYKEDETSEILAAIEKANKELEMFR